MDSIRNDAVIRKPSKLIASLNQQANFISANTMARVKSVLASAFAPSFATVAA